MSIRIDTPTLRGESDPFEQQISSRSPLSPSDRGSAASVEPAINIIIPIGGIGSRFAKQGYRFPKPLINIVGRPMLLWLIDNLSLRPCDTLWMAVNEELDDEFRIGQLVSKTFPKVDFKFLRLRHQTKGASETVRVLILHETFI